MIARTDPDQVRRIASRFREELHAIEAVMAGQGIAICSDLLVRKELSDGALVSLSPVSLDGYGLYFVTLPEQSAKRTVQDFGAWMERAFSAASSAPVRRPGGESE